MSELKDRICQGGHPSPEGGLLHGIRAAQPEQELRACAVGRALFIAIMLLWPRWDGLILCDVVPAKAMALPSLYFRSIT